MIKYKIEKKLIIFLPLINFIFDIIVGFTRTEEGSIGQIRGILLFLVALVYWKKFVKVDQTAKWILIYFFYLVGLSLFHATNTGNLFSYFSHVLKVVLSISFFSIALYSINNAKEYYNFLDSILLLTFVFVLYLILANIFNIGHNYYSEEDNYIIDQSLIKTGFIGGTAINTLSFCLIILPTTLIANIRINNIKKFIILCLIFIGIVLLILILRRSAIIIVLFTYAYYLISSKSSFRKFSRYIIIIGVFIFITFPFFSNYLFSSIEVRGNKTLQIENIQAELRSVETMLVLEKVFSFDDVFASLVGYGFETKALIAGLPSQRSLHTDYGNILIRHGILGLIIYLMIHITIFKKMWIVKKTNSRLFLIMNGVLLSSILLMYSGRFTSITFRLVIFLFLGATTGFLMKQDKNNKSSNMKHDYSNS